MLVTMSKTGGPPLVAGAQLPDRPWEGLPLGTAEVLRREASGLAPRIAEAIREGVPAYARPLTGAFGEQFLTGVQSALDQFADLVERPHPDGLPGRDVPRALGAAEAREGRSLEALLAAYRIGARVAWREVARVAREADLDADVLALLAESIFAYIDELSAQSAEGYAREQSAAAGEAERRRRLLVGLLVQWPPADPAAVAEAARGAGWELPASLAALVWRRPARDRLAGRLPHGTISAPLGARAGEREDLMGALIPDPAAPGRRGELARAVGEGLAALGPPVPWGEAGRSVRRAAGALRLAAAGRIPGGGLVEAEAHLAELLVHREPALARELARRRLAPLDGLGPGVRARQATTLLAWLDHQGNVPAAARALHVHPQTVRYRFGQLREAFGDALEDPRARFELMLALRAAEDEPSGS